MSGHVLGVGDLGGAGLADVLDLAAAMNAGTFRSRALHGSSLACFLAAPATWRRVVVGTAARRLGVEPVMLAAEEVEELRRDPAGDTPRMLSGFVAALVVGTLPQGALREIAQRATVPVLNAGSDEHDPCQAVADMLTLRERFGDLRGRILAYVGAADRSVAHSLMTAAAFAGMEVRLACPARRRPAPELRLEAETFADLHGGSIAVLDDAAEAVTGADAVYTSAWPEEERGPHPRRSPMSAYHVDPPLMRRAKGEAVLMHPLPAHRGEEVSAFVLESGQSVVWRQAANRLPAHVAAIVYATGARDDSRERDRSVCERTLHDAHRDDSEPKQAARSRCFAEELMPSGRAPPAGAGSRAAGSHGGHEAPGRAGHAAFRMGSDSRIVQADGARVVAGSAAGRLWSGRGGGEVGGRGAGAVVDVGE